MTAAGTAPVVAEAPPAAWRNRIVGTGEEKPDQLLANDRNWRIHPRGQQDALASVLDRVGWVGQVLVNQRSGKVVDGHLRVALAISRDEPTVPVLYVDLTDEEEALVLASLDPLASMAITDEAKLAELLAEVSIDQEDLERTLVSFFSSKRREGLTDPDELPEAREAPTVQTGEVWLLGEHRLLCGDATDPAAVAQLFAGGGLADCLWTDPPYGVNYVGKTAESLTLAKDDADGSDEVLLGALRSAPLKPSAPFYIACPAGPRMRAFFDALDEVGWRLQQELVWVKGTIVLGHSDYHYAHEPILYGWIPGAGRPGRGRHEGTRWYGDHSQSTVLEYPKPAANREHPTAKPVGLMAQCLGNSTQPGAVVYDPFAGSGSTLIAAETLGRRCYAMEIEPRYVQVTIERWRGLTGREAERVDD